MNDQNAPAIATTMVDNLVVNGLAAWQDGIAALLDSLPETAISEVERWAREALGGTPVPLDPTTRSELARRRAILERLAAEAAARDGRPEELLALLLKAWREHRESPAPYVEYLVELGRNDEAAVMAVRE
jgi:hypothetical protein